RHDLLGQSAHRAGRRGVVVDRLSRHFGGGPVHWPVPAGRVDERAYRPAQPTAAHGGGGWGMTATPAADTEAKRPSPCGPRAPVLTVEDLKAYYRRRHFGIEREVRAVDGVSFEVRDNEIYGL